jgi:hypothetical protein
MSREEKSLDLIALFHHVLAIITGITALTPIIHFIFGVMLLNVESGAGDPAPRVFALIFIILSTLIILAGWTLAVLIFIAGNKIRNRQSYNYCMIIAFIECLLLPLGPILGIYTIITLNKEEYIYLFE